MIDLDRFKTCKHLDPDLPHRDRSGLGILALGLPVVAALAVIGWMHRPGPRTTEARARSAGTRPAAWEQGQADPAGQAGLPVLADRHDPIQDDVSGLGSDGDPRGTVVPDEGPVRTAAEPCAPGPRVVREDRPKLRAISVGPRPQAWIDDVLVSVGEKVKLNRQGWNDDEWEVAAMDGRTVSLTRGHEILVLRLEPEQDASASGGQGGPSEPY